MANVVEVLMLRPHKSHVNCPPFLNFRTKSFACRTKNKRITENG